MCAESMAAVAAGCDQVSNMSAGEECVRARAIERMADPIKGYNLGPIVQKTFNDLRGDA